jgi:hypothetical protein
LNSWSQQLDRDEAFQRICVPFLFALFQLTTFFAIFGEISWRASAAIGGTVGLAASWTALKRGRAAGIAFILIAQLLILFVVEVGRR